MTTCSMVSDTDTDTQTKQAWCCRFSGIGVAGVVTFGRLLSVLKNQQRRFFRFVVGVVGLS